MSALVIDASACVQAAMSVDGFGPLEGRRLIAPPLMWSEATSAVHELLWRGAISPDLAESARERLLVAPVERLDAADLYSAAWEVAESLGWAKTYDAEYVAAARLAACPLLTIDARLQRGVRRLIEVLVPTDL